MDYSIAARPGEGDASVHQQKDGVGIGVAGTGWQATVAPPLGGTIGPGARCRLSMVLTVRSFVARCAMERPPVRRRCHVGFERVTIRFF